jgi:hypothetical protein
MVVVLCRMLRRNCARHYCSCRLVSVCWMLVARPAARLAISLKQNAQLAELVAIDNEESRLVRVRENLARLDLDAILFVPMRHNLTAGTMKNCLIVYCWMRRVPVQVLFAAIRISNICGVKVILRPSPCVSVNCLGRCGHCSCRVVFFCTPRVQFCRRKMKTGHP